MLEFESLPVENIPVSVLGQGTLLREGPNGLCHTSSATPRERRRELMFDLAALSPNPSQVSPALLFLVIVESAYYYILLAHHSRGAKGLKPQMMMSSQGDEDISKLKVDVGLGMLREGVKTFLQNVPLIIKRTLTISSASLPS